MLVFRCCVNHNHNLISYFFNIHKNNNVVHVVLQLVIKIMIYYFELRIEIKN